VQVSEAIEHADCVVAVTARLRKFAAPSIYPRDLARVLEQVAQDVGVEGGGLEEGRGVAVMFGSERNGLTSDELATVRMYCMCV